MSDAIIQVENLSKLYHIGHLQKGKVSAGRALAQAAAMPFKRTWGLLTGHAAATADLDEELWALKDVNFEVKPGEVLGIIGRNGAGKSTLLKILSRIVEPTAGRITIKGRMGSLLEVGTGFHPDLTGRENVYLNGSMLGMRTSEIDRKFDEIVAFSEVEKFIDTPVKHYSSGMYTRLAFAVAAHLEPEILIVDEVLAVGDAAFQKKCLDKMKKVTSDGRTILFVSHQMAAIQNLCHRCLHLRQGQVVGIGGRDEILVEYIRSITPQNDGPDLSQRTDRSGSGEVKLVSFHVESAQGERLPTVFSGMDVDLVFGFERRTSTPLNYVDVGLSLADGNNQILVVFYSSFTHQTFGNLPRQGQFRCRIPRLPLTQGRYVVGARVEVRNQEADWPHGGVGHLDVEGGDFYRTGSNAWPHGAPLLIAGDWRMETASANR